VAHSEGRPIAGTLNETGSPEGSSKRLRIALYGNFGAGNLGNEITLQAIINQIRCREPNADLLCFCTDPRDVRARHAIRAIRSAVNRTERPGSGRRQGTLTWIFRIVFRWIPLEVAHWMKSLREIRGTNMLIVAGTGIVTDYLCGPLGWPYDIFKLFTLGALCRTRRVFLGVGAGPIQTPIGRWLLKTSLGLANQRSYRDEASKQYLKNIGINVEQDLTHPDVVFGFSKTDLLCCERAGPQRVVGLGIKDYASKEWHKPTALSAYRQYLDNMATFVSFLQMKGYAVRLLIGDINYDTQTLTEFLSVLKNRNIPATRPLTIVEPALTVGELLRQIRMTDIVVSTRYHNLVMALIQGKPVIALSDHAKLDSLVTDFGLQQYLLHLESLNLDALFGLFADLETNVEKLIPYIEAKTRQYSFVLDRVFNALLADDMASGARGNVAANTDAAIKPLVDRAT
jgi:polysaccharide pyruvyl transferase WcaK-like protein